MPELGMIPVWALVVAGSALLVVVGTALFWFIVGRKMVVRRYLVKLIARRESVRASRRTLEAVVRHLVDEPDEALVEFAYEAHSPDRRTLAEIAAQMKLILDELDTRPLPSRLVRVAEELSDAAFVLAEEASRITDEMSPEDVLAALSEMDLTRVIAQIQEADRWVDDACEEYDVEDAAVYGGGLYI